MPEEASADAKKNRSKRRPLFVGLTLGACATVVVAILSVSDGFKTLELKAYDIRLRRWPSIAMSDRVLMVDIDDASIEAIGEFPFPRSKHATLVAELTALGADRVLFDVEFPDPSPPSVDREAMRRLINLPAEEINAPDVLRAIQAGEGDIEKLFPQAIAKADRAVESVGDVRITTVDNDALLASAIAAADEVYIPFSLEKTYIYGDEAATWYDRAEAILRKNLEADGEAVAKAIGVAPETVTHVETSLKRRVVKEYLEETDKEGKKSCDEICAALIPRARGGSKSFEEQLIEAERDLYLGTLHVEKIAGFVPDQNWEESIETFPEIRPAVLTLTR